MKTFNTASELRQFLNNNFNTFISTINGVEVKLPSVSHKHVIDEYTGKSFNGVLIVKFK